MGIRACVYGHFAEDTNLLPLSVFKPLMTQPVTFSLDCLWYLGFHTSCSNEGKYWHGNYAKFTLESSHGHPTNYF